VIEVCVNGKRYAAHFRDGEVTQVDVGFSRRGAHVVVWRTIWLACRSRPQSPVVGAVIAKATQPKEPTNG